MTLQMGFLQDDPSRPVTTAPRSVTTPSRPVTTSSRPVPPPLLWRLQHSQTQTDVRDLYRWLKWSKNIENIQEKRSKSTIVSSYFCLFVNLFFFYIYMNKYVVLFPLVTFCLLIELKLFLSDTSCLLQSAWASPEAWFKIWIMFTGSSSRTQQCEIWCLWCLKVRLIIDFTIKGRLNVSLRALRFQFGPF